MYNKQQMLLLKAGKELQTAFAFRRRADCSHLRVAWPGRNRSGRGKAAVSAGTAHYKSHREKEVGMGRDALITTLRGFHYAVGILSTQQNDPLCNQCAAFARTAEAIVDSFIKFQENHASEKRKLPEEFSLLFSDTSDRVSVIEPPEGTVRQKKAGNCKLPPGVCFTKEVTAFLQKINQ